MDGLVFRLLVFAALASTALGNIRDCFENGCCAAKNLSILNTIWSLPTTPNGKDANVSCPLNSSFAIWRCGHGSKWEETPDLRQCRSFMNISVQENGTSVTDIITNLDDYLNGASILPGDLKYVVQELKSRGLQLENKTECEDHPMRFRALRNIRSKLREQPNFWKASAESGETPSSDWLNIVGLVANMALKYYSSNYTNNQSQKDLFHQCVTNETRVVKHAVIREKCEPCSTIEYLKESIGIVLLEKLEKCTRELCGKCLREERLLPNTNTTQLLLLTSREDVFNFSCPESKLRSIGSWRCGSNSMWDETPDLSLCTILPDEPIPPYVTIVDKLDKIYKSITSNAIIGGDVIQTIERVNSVLAQHDDDDANTESYGKESKESLSIIENIRVTLLGNQRAVDGLPAEVVQAVQHDLNEIVIKAAVRVTRPTSIPLPDGKFITCMVKEADKKGQNVTLLEGCDLCAAWGAIESSQSDVLRLAERYVAKGCGKCLAGEHSYYDNKWDLNTTNQGNVFNIECPLTIRSVSSYGTWRCGNNSLWDETPDLSHCRNTGDEFEAANKYGNLTAPDIIEKVAQTLKDEDLLAGDILYLTKGLDTLLKQFENEDYGNETIASDKTQNFMKNLVNLTEAMLKKPVWNSMGEEDKADSFSVLQTVIDSAARSSANHTQSYYQETVEENLGITVINQSPSYYTKEKRLFKSPVKRGTELQLPKNFYKNYTSEDRIFVSFLSLTGVPGQEALTSFRNLSDNVTKTKVVNSVMMGAVVGDKRPWKAEQGEFVQIVFVHIVSGSTEVTLENVTCTWWNNGAKTWSYHGCNVSATNASHTVCFCDHLTNIAVIMDVTGVLRGEETLNEALTLITIVGCSLSIISLAICIICFGLLIKLNGQDKPEKKVAKMYKIRLSFCVCLFLAQFILLVGLDQTQHKALCTVIAALLHYFFLSTFTWSAIEAFNLYLKVRMVFEAHMPDIKMKHFLMVGFGLPLFLVGGTVAVCQGNGYGTKYACWLEPKGIIWSFVGSLACIMLINSVCFIMVMKVVWESRGAGTAPSKNASYTAGEIKKLVGSIAIFLLLGLTWITGFLYFAEATKEMALLFSVLNSLQGVGILIFSVLLDKKVKGQLLGFISVKLHKNEKVPMVVRQSITKAIRKSAYLPEVDDYGDPVEGICVETSCISTTEQTEV